MAIETVDEDNIDQRFACGREDFSEAKLHDAVNEGRRHCCRRVEKMSSSDKPTIWKKKMQMSSGHGPSHLATLRS
jgi:hypothetical protein